MNVDMWFFFVIGVFREIFLKREENSSTVEKCAHVTFTCSFPFNAFFGGCSFFTCRTFSEGLKTAYQFIYHHQLIIR